MHASLSKFYDVRFVLVPFSLLFLGFCTDMLFNVWPGSESCVYYVLFDRELTRAGGACRLDCFFLGVQYGCHECQLWSYAQYAVNLTF